MIRIFPMLLFLSIVAPSYAELTECEGVWTNVPCDSKASQTLQSIKPDQQAPRGRLRSTIPSRSADQVYTGFMTKHPVEKTEIAEVEIITEEVETSSSRFKVVAEISGRGRTVVSGVHYYSVSSGSKKDFSKRLTSKTLLLPQQGGSGKVSWFVNNSNLVTDWKVRVHALSTYQHYDLGTCCASNDAGNANRCETTGEVRCSDGSVSSICKCGAN